MDLLLSNKKTPKYYKSFRQKVLQNKIPVCKEISMEMNRIDSRIRNPNFFYDPKPVEGFIKFCESELTKTDGSSVKLLETFKLWSEQLLGWYYYTERNIWNEEKKKFEQTLIKKRLINKQYLIVARGAAKSMYASFIQAYFLIVDGSTSNQITTAPTMKQAYEIISPITTAINRSPGPLLSFLTTESKLYQKRYNYKTLIASTKRGVENFITSSILEIRPMSIPKLQGLRPQVSTIDEWLSTPIREDVIGAIEQGASKLEDYIILATSSEGTFRNAAGDEIKLELSKILSGEYNDPYTSIFHYKLDNIEEIDDPFMWLKAQPNLGYTVSYETYEREVERAENSPSARIETLPKRFGLPTSGYTFYFTYEETIPHTKKNYKGMECVLGVDLSQVDDFCSFTFLFPIKKDLFGIRSLNFVTTRSFDSLPPLMRLKYESFIKEGSLIVLEGSLLNIEEIFFILDDFINDNKFEIIALGYDPWNADQFIKLWKETYGPYNVEVVRQGSRTESVPLGEIKILSEDRRLHFDEKIFEYAMGNCMVEQDSNGNRKLFKARYEHKIDPVAALLDAFVAYNRHLEYFE